MKNTIAPLASMRVPCIPAALHLALDPADGVFADPTVEQLLPARGPPGA
jgi:hypothetical protein